MSEWKPISEIPEGEIVLAYWPNGEMHVGTFYENEWCPDFDTDSEWSLPTHWMRLPDEPSQSDAAGEQT